MTTVGVLGYFFSAVCVAAALYVAFGRSVLWTTIAFFLELGAAGGVLLSMNADYLALLVIALALLGTLVVTTYSSVILGGLNRRFAVADGTGRNKAARIASFVMGAAAGGAIGVVLLSPPFLARLREADVAGTSGAADVHTLGNLLLGEHLVVFEMLGVLILIVLVGAGVLLRGNSDGRQ